jgi:hypothetical protein
MAQNVSKTTTDHDTIRRWAEERGGAPAEVASTGGEARTGILRIDFPGYSGEGELRRIPWDEWFAKFDDSGLAFVYQDATAGGERSNFNKLVARETARARGGRTSRRSAGTAARARAGGRARTSASSARKGASRGGKTAKRGAGRASPSRKTAAGKGKATARRSTRATGARSAARPATARATTSSRSRAGAAQGKGRTGGGKSRTGGRTSRRSGSRSR